MKKSEILPFLFWYWKMNSKIDRHLLSKNYIDAISLCNQMLEKNGKDLLAYYYRGISQRELGFLDASVADLWESEKVLKKQRWKWVVKDYYVKIPLQLSKTYVKMRNTKAAIDCAGVAINADLKDVDGLKWRATLKEEAGDVAGALEDVNEAMRRRPKDKALVKMRDRLTYVFIEDKKDANR